MVSFKVSWKFSNALKIESKTLCLESFSQLILIELSEVFHLTFCYERKKSQSKKLIKRGRQKDNKKCQYRTWMTEFQCALYSSIFQVQGWLFALNYFSFNICLQVLMKAAASASKTIQWNTTQPEGEKKGKTKTRMRRRFSYLEDFLYRRCLTFIFLSTHRSKDTAIKL